MPIESSHASYSGCTKIRGTDAPLRIALAVEALLIAGYPLKSACITVSEYPSVTEELDRHKSGSDVGGRAERVRRRYNKQIEQYGELAFRQMFRGWLSAYRKDHDGSDSWRREQIEALTLLADSGNGPSAVHVGRLYHELGQFDQARSFYERALEALAAAGERIRSVAIPWIKRQIDNCNRQLGPDPNPSIGSTEVVG